MSCLADINFEKQVWILSGSSREMLTITMSGRPRPAHSRVDKKCIWKKTIWPVITSKRRNVLAVEEEERNAGAKSQMPSLSSRVWSQHVYQALFLNVSIRILYIEEQYLYSWKTPFLVSTMAVSVIMGDCFLCVCVGNTKQRLMFVNR